MERHFCTPDCFGLFARTASCFGAFCETEPSRLLWPFCSERLMCGSTRFVILPFVVLYRIRFFNFSCIFRNCRAIANRHIGTCKSCVAGEMSVGPKILIRYIGACVGAVPYFFVCSHCAQNYFPPSTVFRRLDLCCHQAYCQPSAECIGRSRGGILRHRRSTSL